MGCTIDVETAREILGHLWSENDPIWHKNKETTIEHLSYEIPNANASRVKIKFYSLNSRGYRPKEGTVLDMIINRLGVKTK